MFFFSFATSFPELKIVKIYRSTERKALTDIMGTLQLAKYGKAPTTLRLWDTMHYWPAISFVMADTIDMIAGTLGLQGAPKRRYENFSVSKTV